MQSFASEFVARVEGPDAAPYLSLLALQTFGFVRGELLEFLQDGSPDRIPSRRLDTTLRNFPRTPFQLGRPRSRDLIV